MCWLPTGKKGSDTPDLSDKGSTLSYYPTTVLGHATTLQLFLVECTYPPQPGLSEQSRKSSVQRTKRPLELWSVKERSRTLGTPSRLRPSTGLCTLGDKNEWLSR